jgi:hypothetical protein
MMSEINEMDMGFEEIKNFNIVTMGSVPQIARPCPIKYTSMERQQPQVQQDRTKFLTEFIKEGQVNLKHGETYNVPVIFDYRLYFLPFSQVFQSYYLVLLTYRKVKTIFLRPLTQHLTV